MESWSKPSKVTNYCLQSKWVTDSVFCIFYFLLYMSLILLWFPIKHTYIIETRSFSIHRVFKIYFPLEQRVIWYQYRLVFLSGLKGRRFSISIWEWIFWGTTEHVLLFCCMFFSNKVIHVQPYFTPSYLKKLPLISWIK